LGNIQGERFNPVEVNGSLLARLRQSNFPVVDETIADAMKEEVMQASGQMDSVGGIIECCALGVPGGIGGPLFGGIESRMSLVLFGIPAVKGVEFGAGFQAAAMKGSMHNDPYYFDNDRVKTKTNNHGGILGGISTGMPLMVRVAFKPTPSIGLPQQTVDLKNRRDATIAIQGRHDPCIVPRAVPCVEAAAAAVLLDMML
jgi:chorismate synthase